MPPTAAETTARPTRSADHPAVTAQATPTRSSPRIADRTAIGRAPVQAPALRDDETGDRTRIASVAGGLRSRGTKSQQDHDRRGKRRQCRRPPDKMSSHFTARFPAFSADIRIDAAPAPGSLPADGDPNPSEDKVLPSRRVTASRRPGFVAPTGPMGHGRPSRPEANSALCGRGKNTTSGGRPESRSASARAPRRSSSPRARASADPRPRPFPAERGACASGTPGQQTMTRAHLGVTRAT